MKFALFIIVFVLYGCASGSRSQTMDLASTQNLQTSNQTNAISTTSRTYGLRSVDNDVRAVRLFANDEVSSAKVSSLYQARDAKGKLHAQQAMKDYSAKLGSKIKKDVEEKKARTFQPYTTTYGIDCYGCNYVNGRGGTASGVALDSNLGVRMPDGSWQPGIRYGKYYIVAADPSIPMCSILKISNHGLSGSGISVNEPYYAIVLDRGGAIHGTHIDLYIGLESSGAIRKVQNTTPSAEIIRLGGQTGAGSCAL